MDPSLPAVSCPHSEDCPGCPLIGLSYPEQLETKLGKLKTAISPYGELSAMRLASVAPAEPVEGYRVRAKLVMSGSHVGLFARGSHRVVDTAQCRVLHPVLASAAQAIRQLSPLGVAVSAIDLRHTEEGTLCSIVVPEGTADAEVLAAALSLSSGVPSLVGVAVSRRVEGSARVLGATPVTAVGLSRARVHLREGGPFYFATHGAFVQAHPGQQRAIASRMVQVIEERRGRVSGAEVLELFSGSGALALELASRGARVTAVEAFEPAARLAEEAARAQGLPVQSEVGDADAVVRRLVERRRRFDVVVVNPPRRGLPPGLRAALALLAPRVLLYVSCEPATLSRDLADLSRRGLQAETLIPFDMIPLSEEVETLAALTPGEAPLPEVLHQDLRLLAVVKPPHQSMVSQGEGGGSLQDRVRLLSGAGRATPAHRMDEVTSGVALFALRSEDVPVIGRALLAGEQEYTTLARGVVRDKGSIRRALPERGQPYEARTRYARRAIVGGHSLVTARPDEGRKHQVRRHLASIGHGVVGDERYGHAPTNQHFGALHFLDRPFLHLARVVLALDGGPLELVAKLPPDLESVLGSLRRGGEPRDG